MPKYRDIRLTEQQCDAALLTVRHELDRVWGVILQDDVPEDVESAMWKAKDMLSGLIGELR